MENVKVFKPGEGVQDVQVAEDAVLADVLADMGVDPGGFEIRVNDVKVDNLNAPFVRKGEHTLVAMVPTIRGGIA